MTSFPYHCIVVGAGPAGLFAALNAALAGARVHVLEKKPSPGNKLLLAGSGRCNITHAGPVREFFSHYGANGRFMKHALMSFTNSHLIEFFTDRGLDCITEDSGKVFPSAGGSRAVLDILLKESRNAGVSFEYGSAVETASIENGVFQVSAGGGLYRCSALIVACGGRSYPATGSSGDGYGLATNFGHTVTPPVPALVPLITEEPTADLAGISLADTVFTIERGGAIVFRHRGDLLFTHTGLSGPGILDAGRYVRAGDIIAVNLCGLEREPAVKELAHLCGGTSRSFKNAVASLGRGIPDRLAAVICNRCGADAARRAAETSAAVRRAAAGLACGFTLTVKKKAGWGAAMATAGGVSLDEVDPKTMGSRLVPGLFFAGEVLDIDGDTGGYNLQAAFSTGRLAGNAAGRFAASIVSGFSLKGSTQPPQCGYVSQRLNN